MNKPHLLIIASVFCFSYSIHADNCKEQWMCGNK